MQRPTFTSVCVSGIMVCDRKLLQLLLLACLTSSLRAGEAFERHVLTAPQAPVLEIGTNFTATCILINTTKATAADLLWIMSERTIPKDQYTKINESAVSVTISISSQTPAWLFCKCEKPSSPYVSLYTGRFVHGILMKKGYRPEKPENLSCVALQEKSLISPVISCVWEPKTRESKDFPTKYMLNIKKQLMNETFTTMAKSNNSGQVALDIFPHHMSLEVWVTVQNELGMLESDHLTADADWFVKTNPPAGVSVISEKSFPTSLLITWKRPIAKEYVKLIYQIRYRSQTDQTWINVPPADTARDIQSFRIQYLQPDTVYVTQVRCKNAQDGYGYWSDWSSNATASTPETRHLDRMTS
ncbi:hypothetical protein LDENG_00165090 [Lucifuga dentata]|nr:hypothetical protein LDENG_00165090 [Lucifuga dentata]